MPLVGLDPGVWPVGPVAQTPKKLISKECSIKQVSNDKKQGEGELSTRGMKRQNMRSGSYKLLRWEQGAHTIVDRETWHTGHVK